MDPELSVSPGLFSEDFLLHNQLLLSISNATKASLSPLTKIHYFHCVATNKHKHPASLKKKPTILILRYDHQTKSLL
jgi:hypothetical protein